jgi:hypothetical protein
VPGMKTTRIARRLGLDRNPLRRHTDKIAACVAVLLLAVFLIGAPLLSVAAAGWAGRAGASGQRAERSWRQVSAILMRASSAPSPSAAGVSGYSWVLARWTAPDGRTRTSEIPVSTAMAADHTVRLWVDAAGSPTGPPLNHRSVVADEAAAAAVATGTLAIVLLCLALAGRWVLGRRQLADWEAAWAAVGPHWTKRFRSRGLACRPLSRLANHRCRNTGVQPCTSHLIRLPPAQRLRIPRFLTTPRSLTCLKTATWCNG